jgi:hypothetical protein
MSFAEVQIENIRQLIGDLKSECESERARLTINRLRPPDILEAIAMLRVREIEAIIEKIESAISR